MESSPPHSSDRPTYFRAAGVFDGLGDEVQTGVGLLVQGSRVLGVVPPAEASRQGATEVDLGRNVLMPGYVDAHTHVTIRPWEGDQHGKVVAPAVWQTVRGGHNLQNMLLSGVTTAKIMSELFDIDFYFREAVEAGEVAGPRLKVSGPGLAPPGGHGSFGRGVAGEADLRATIAKLAAQGADHIKIFATGGTSSESGSTLQCQYSASELAAIVEESAAHGLTVAAHAHGGDGVSLALKAGVHTIEHGGMLDEENLDLLLSGASWLVLTSTIRFHPDGIELGDGSVPSVMAKLHDGREAGRRVIKEVRASGLTRIALGSDSMHGMFAHEMVWLAKQGWSNVEALRAGTSAGAQLMSLPDVGTLAEGSLADFVALGGDPVQDITATTDVQAVVKAGQLIVESGRIIPPVTAPKGPRATPKPQADA